jgi:hypothetical protein
MLKRHPIHLAAAALLIGSLACSQSAPAPAADPNALNTSIAQTIAARQTEALLSNPSTASFTSAPETPTPTLEPTPSETPDFTATPTTPTISVSVDTNCRTGPGAIFERVGILLVGETAEIVGREPKGEYWYIRNPDTGPEFCWVWGEYATISGNTLFLLYLSPAPPPPTSFTASFDKMETCSVWWMDFRLVNNSGVAFRSMSLSVRDADTNTVASQESNSFANSDSCSAPVTVEQLVSGGAVTVSSPPFGYNPAGHNLSARITLCTEPDQKGTCVTQEFNFKP